MKKVTILALLGLVSHSVSGVALTRPFKLGEDTIDFDELSDPVKEEPAKVQVSFEALVQADSSMLSGF